MTLDRQAAHELILRFKILEKFPKTDEGVKALVDALLTVASPVKAERLVESWIKNNRRAPMPCDVYDAIGRASEPMRHASALLPPLPRGQEPPPLEYRCNQCEDTGWYIITTNRPIPDLPGEFYTAAKRCPHPLEARGSKYD